MEPQETQVTVRLPFLISGVIILIVISSMISYRLGSERAWDEITENYTRMESQLTSAMCLLASEDNLRRAESEIE